MTESIKELFNWKELWLFWLSVIAIIFSVILYRLVLQSPIRDFVVLVAVIFFIIITIQKFLK
jgi:hypothetical protein